MKSIAREACIKIKNNPQQWKQIYKEFSFFLMFCLINQWSQKELQSPDIK